MDEADSVEARCAAHERIMDGGRFEAGTVFGEWRLTAFIGRGGSGEVYCAEHVRIGIPAAVKVLVRDDERAKGRFEREAKILSSLKSSAFPRFFAYGEANGVPYLVMELLQPGDLPSDDRAVAAFMLKVCGVVAELHALGLVHRDIKPSNILWRTGRTGASPVREQNPVLADLGLVKSISSTPSIRLDDSLSIIDGQRVGVGTPGYGAPEQMERGEATIASDIHALGVLADRCFGGNPPRQWQRIIQRATSSILAYRYMTIAEFAHDIRWRNLWRNVAIGVLIVFLVGLLIDILVLAGLTAAAIAIWQYA